MQFRKKPVVIDAYRWFKNGDHPDDYTKPERGVTIEHRRTHNWEGDVVRYFRHPSFAGDAPCFECGLLNHYHGWMDTKEGGHRVCPGDWIITGVAGERYPCKPAIFAATYDLA